MKVTVRKIITMEVLGMAFEEIIGTMISMIYYGPMILWIAIYWVAERFEDIINFVGRLF